MFELEGWIQRNIARNRNIKYSFNVSIFIFLILAVFIPCILLNVMTNRELQCVFLRIDQVTFKYTSQAYTDSDIIEVYG